MRFRRGSVTVTLTSNLAQGERFSDAALVALDTSLSDAIDQWVIERNNVGAKIVEDLTKHVDTMDGHIAEAKRLHEEGLGARGAALRQEIGKVTELGEAQWDRMKREVEEKYKARFAVGLALGNLQVCAARWRGLLNGAITTSVGLALTEQSRNIARDVITLSAKSPSPAILPLSGEIGAIGKLLGAAAGNLE
jgi:uncharacterized protein YicC (UPF0701 family)